MVSHKNSIERGFPYCIWITYPTFGHGTLVMGSSQFWFPWSVFLKGFEQDFNIWLHDLLNEKLHNILNSNTDKTIVIINISEVFVKLSPSSNSPWIQFDSLNLLQVSDKERIMDKFYWKRGVPDAARPMPSMKMTMPKPSIARRKALSFFPSSLALPFCSSETKAGFSSGVRRITEALSLCPFCFCFCFFLVFAAVAVSDKPNPFGAESSSEEDSEEGFWDLTVILKVGLMRMGEKTRKVCWTEERNRVCSNIFMCGWKCFW